jgi:hypothetical protein
MMHLQWKMRQLKDTKEDKGNRYQRIKNSNSEAFTGD